MGRSVCFLGVTCIDGNCPMSLADEYQERGMDVIMDCSDCYVSLGKCEDCYFYETEYCVHHAWDPSN